MHTALGCLSLCAQFANISIDINAICNKYALKDSEPSIYELAKIAKDNDFKVKIKKLNLKNLHLYKAPFIFLKKNLTYFVVLKLDFNNQQALIFDGGKEARQISYEELHNLSSDKILILAHKLLNDSVKFGFSWFYKRMLSYKGIVLQILLASFVMQLFGLVTPLFTQVVLDKVLLHHSISTLNVIAFAFFSVIVFESLLDRKSTRLNSSHAQ